MDHLAIIALWPSLDALSAETGIKRDSVRKWKQRGEIPPRAWPKVLEAAKERRLREVTCEALLEGMR